MKSITGAVLLVGAVFLFIWSVAASVVASNEYEREISSAWNLSEKSSTLEQKSAYLDKFVAAVEGANLSGNDAMWLKTPDNAIDQNMVALHSLQQRMNEIKGMDVKSFEYQQAIAQITQQEQGEAGQMLRTIQGVWFLTYHPLLWDWIELVKMLVLIVLGVVGIVIIVFSDEY